MANTNPTRGMRDFLPSDVRKRNYVISIIKEVYEKYGFEPLETPSVENLETLMGKYGEEGNQLIFKILKRGEKLDVSQGEQGLSDLALRYDLTVPLARVVANYKEKLPKFFKRYQIQPVWRADRPARGRFREFYQCDVDAIGSKSMVVEAELISAVCEILEKLGFDDFVVLLNHRELLFGFLEVCGIDVDKQMDALVGLDKLDKIGKEKVIVELEEKKVFKTEKEKKLFGEFIDLVSVISPRMAFNTEEIRKIGMNEEKVRQQDAFNNITFSNLEKFISDNPKGFFAIHTLKQILKFVNNTNGKGRVNLFPTLARGLSYYTGSIFEVGLNSNDFTLSVGGGGRYDGLIGMFGKEQIPACGFSLGLERILVVMEERGMFPLELQTNSADVLVTIWNEESIAESLKLANELRQTGLRVLVYPEADKLGKQFKYADTVGVKFVCVLGESELDENKVTVKDLAKGEQQIVERENVAIILKES